METVLVIPQKYCNMTNQKSAHASLMETQNFAFVLPPSINKERKDG
jgi:hypothetical protein